MTMTRPADWVGSDLRSRTEVVRYLAEHGRKITDKSGLIVGNMARELGRGRALSQLLQDMEKDGMLRREIRGRRTFELELLDDWGLVPSVVPLPAPVADEPGTIPEGVDYGLLAESLLAITLKRAAQPIPAPEQTDGRLTARLKQAEKALAQANDQCKAMRLERDAATAEAGELREKVEILSHNQEVLTKQLTARPTGRGAGVSIADRLSKEERDMLSSLMTALPESPQSKKREPKKRTR